MDRRVKERLIGASILVVLIVLIVPELLSGPAPAPIAAGPRLPASAPEPIRNITVDLATATAPAQQDTAEPAASAAQPPAAPRESAPGATAAAVSGGTTGEAAGVPTEASPPSEASLPSEPSPAQSQNQTSKPLDSAAPAPTKVKKAAAPRPAPGGRSWAVQLGSFASRANADKLERQARAQGFSAYVSSGGSGPSLRYRVRVGPMADREAATQTETKLKSLGHPASLVSPAH